MKNILSLFALIACFTFLASSSAVAQDTYANYTNCPFDIKIVYGDSGTCTVQGVLTISIGANSTGSAGIPNGTEILYLKGRYQGTNCAFYVGQSTCSPYTDTDDVTCGSGCGNYSVNFDPAIGFKIYH